MDKALIPIKKLIQDGWKLYSNNWKTLYTPLLLFLPFFSFLYIDQLLPQIESKVGVVIFVILTLILFFFSLIVYLWGAIVLYSLIYKLHAGEKFDLKKLYYNCFYKTPSFFWVGFLTFLIVLTGFILLIIPGIFFAIWYNYACIVTACEDKKNKGLDALTYIKSLVKGRAWDTYGRMFVPSLFIMAIVYGCALICLILLWVSKVPFETALVIVYWLTLIANFLMIPLLTAFEVILYRNLKQTRKLTSE